MHRIKKIGFIKILDIWFDEALFEKAKDKIVSLHTNSVLDRSDYDFKLTGQTFLLDITREEQDISSGFDYKSCRYCINRAERDGIHVWKAQNEIEKAKYLDFQNSFCEEKEIPKVDERELNELEVYCAETPEKEFLGGCAFIISADHKTVRYKYGATAHRFNANEAILWKAICDYHKRSFEIFDFGGCVQTDDRESYYYRHYHFKKKFGGELADSFTYFKIRGIYRVYYWLFVNFVQIFFHNDVNGFVVWLNKKGFIQ